MKNQSKDEFEMMRSPRIVIDNTDVYRGVGIEMSKKNHTIEISRGVNVVNGVRQLTRSVNAEGVLNIDEKPMGQNRIRITVFGSGSWIWGPEKDGTQIIYYLEKDKITPELTLEDIERLSNVRICIFWVD